MVKTEMTLTVFSAVTTSPKSPPRPMLRRLSSSVHTAVAAGRRPIAVRSYSVARETVAKTRRLGAEAFPNEPSLSFLKARLVAALNPPSTSAHDRRPEASEVLAAAAPLLDPSKRNVLDPYLRLIAVELSQHYKSTPIPLEEIPNLSATLAACCLSPQGISKQRGISNDKVSTINERYTDWLIYESRSGDVDRINVVLDSFESQVTLLEVPRLTVPLAAAWAALRSAAGRTGGPTLSVQAPHSSTVKGYLSKKDVLTPENEAMVTQMFPELNSVTTFPSSVDALQTALLGFREREKIQSLTELWKMWCDNPPKDLPRGEVLAKFLHAARWRPTAVTSSEDRQALKQLGKEIMARVPTPTPLPVLQVLLSTAGDFEQDKPKDKRNVLPAAMKTWQQAKAEKVAIDLRTYMTYLGILGKYHADAQLFRTWEELVADERCKKLQEKELAEDSKPGSEVEIESWPPAAALNQVLSAAYLIGGDATTRADNLFDAAVEGKLKTKPDIITVNTALRFAAHIADVQKMNAVIAAAGSLGLKPDIITYTTLVQGLLRAKEHDLASKTLDAMKASGIEPNERMAATLISDLAADGTRDGMRAAEDTLRDMRRRGVKMTVFIWTALITGYFRGNWVLDGFSAMERMNKQGIRFNIVGYNALLRVVADGERNARNEYRRSTSQDLENAKVPLALRLFRQMLDEGVVPNADTYVILLGAFVRTRRDAEALEILKDMDARGFKTNKRALQQLVRQARALKRRQHAH